MEEIINFKILMIGDTTSGKSKLLTRYIDGYFPHNYISTLAVEYKTKLLTVNNIDICLQIWDTSGHEKFRTLSKSFVRGADGIMFVYDITKRQTFDLVKYFIIDFFNETNEAKGIIVGTKCEKENKREVSKNQLKDFCLHYKIEGIEVSYKTWENVSESFEILVKSIIGNRTKKELLNLYRIRNEERLLSISFEKRKKHKLLDKLKNKKENENKIEKENEILKKKDIYINKQKNYSNVLLTKYINY